MKLRDCPTFLLAIFLKSRVAYSANCTASVNPMDVVIVRSGDVHPLPGPNRQTNSAMLTIPTELKSNIKAAHLNVRSLKSRVHFCLVKETILQNKFDIHAISETWTDLTVSGASLEISGYQFSRQDRGSHKNGGGLYIYAKLNLKITVLDDLSLACEDGFKQLWLRVQCRSHKSFLVCNTLSTSTDTPTSCFENLAESFVDALLMELDIIILGDLNCNLLASSLETKSLREFISTFNLNQLVEKPTRITETTISLIDVMMTTNKNIVSLCDVLSCSTSNHHLIYLVLTLKTPRLKPSYITIRSYSNYNAERFHEDLAYLYHST